MHIVRVLIPQIGLFPLEYRTAIQLEVGELIEVPFRNKQLMGIVWEINCQTTSSKLRAVIGKVGFYAKLSPFIIELITRASNYYLASLGTIAKLVLPVDIHTPPFKIDEQLINVTNKQVELSDEQKACLHSIETNKLPSLVKGVTGSGKTEVYFHAIINQLKLGKQTLIMLPEIALSKQIIARFTSRLGFEPVIWNSTITKAKKRKILRGIINGTIRAVIGARSALFLPYKELGIIVVDEEHDASYKQTQGVAYNARDMAVLRGTIENFKIVLVSATPSIESIYNAQAGKYELIEITSRFNSASLPNIKIIDMCKESLAYNSWLSSHAISAIENNLSQNQQILIFLNRRGYAPLVLCKSCGYRANCISCSSAMVMHKELARLECHHCGKILALQNRCPECKNAGLTLCGPGIERIEEEIQMRFPEARTAVVSKDLSSVTSEIEAFLHKMEQGEIDIVIGTQMITKGYHFPKLTLVIVVDADVGFTGGELRASERTFQLLHQVSGRAGRENTKGVVFIQTYMPDHKVIQAFASGSDSEFINAELASRRVAGMPPFSRVATITLSGNNAAKTREIAQQFLSYAPTSEMVRILGPAEAMIHKLSGKYRYKLLIIAPKKFDLQKYLNLWSSSFKIPSIFQMKIDIDPQQLL